MAFLGDSFTFGDWASSIESSFVGLVDAKLAPFEWEALNFGTSGYGLGEMQLQLEQRVFDFEVDAVVVVVFNGNDVRDTFLGKERQFLNFAARNNMRALDLLPAFRARAAADPPPELYVARDIHFNDAGHKLAGDVIGEYLLLNLVLQVFQ